MCYLLRAGAEIQVLWDMTLDKKLLTIQERPECTETGLWEPQFSFVSRLSHKV